VGKFRDWYAANPEMDDKPARFKKPTGLAGGPCMGKCDTSRPSRVAPFSILAALE
jgi:hypothetical protein